MPHQVLASTPGKRAGFYARVVASNRAAPIVCAGAAQRELIERARVRASHSREPHHRIRPPGARVRAPRAGRVVAGLLGVPVALSVVGVPPRDAVIAWEEASLDGQPLAARHACPRNCRTERENGPDCGRRVSIARFRGDTLCRSHHRRIAAHPFRVLYGEGRPASLNAEWIPGLTVCGVLSNPFLRVRSRPVRKRKTNTEKLKAEG